MIDPLLPLPQAAIDLAKSSESFAAIAYWDELGKVWTAGYGETKGVKEGDTRTEPEALANLTALLQTICDRINADCTWDGLTSDEMAALIDFGYNLGIGALEGSTLWRLLMAGDVAGADAGAVVGTTPRPNANRPGKALPCGSNKAIAPFSQICRPGVGIDSGCQYITPRPR